MKIRPTGCSVPSSKSFLCWLSCTSHPKHSLSLPAPRCPPQSPAAPPGTSPTHPSSALPHLQGMVYGSPVGDQLIKCGGIEMLPKGHQSNQLVCRNLGESDKSLPAGTARACLASPAPPTAPHAPPQPRAPVLCCWGFVWTVQPHEEAQHQLCSGVHAAGGGGQRQQHCTGG